MLTDSLFIGASAFVFSTVVITIFGEIAPQAYMSRRVHLTNDLFFTWVRFYEVLLYPIAKPTAFFLDRWLGKEGIVFFQEREVMLMLMKQIKEGKTDVGYVEGIGAINFLGLDDVPIVCEGEIIEHASIFLLPFDEETPCFPVIEPHSHDPFLRKIANVRKKWIIIADIQGTPKMVLDSDQFVRDVLLTDASPDPLRYCYRPLIVSDVSTKLGEVIQKLRVEKEHSEDDVIDQDVVLFWGETRRIITGADVLGRLLRGIVRTVPKPNSASSRRKINRKREKRRRV